MSERLNSEQRSRNMAAVKNKNTAPEIVVRRTLHRLGYRFRLHGRDLPGSPDIVLPRHRTAVFVHGCFWHGHNCPRGARPATRTEFWNAKLDHNLERDRKNAELLKSLDWRVLVIWECETKNHQKLEQLIVDFFHESSEERDGS